MNDQHKALIKKVMLKYLEERGWPNVPEPNKFVFEHAEEMFHILCQMNLVKYADWEQYYMAAIEQYEKAELRRRGVPV